MLTLSVLMQEKKIRIPYKQVADIKKENTAMVSHHKGSYVNPHIR